MRTLLIRTGGTLVATALLLLGLSPPASGQLGGWELSEHRFTGVGFAPSIPSIRSGVAAFHMLESRNLGVYVVARANTDSPHRESNFEPDISPELARDGFDDLEIGRRSSYQAVTLGLIRLVTPTSGLYLGAGFARGRDFIEFRDPSTQRGWGGYYWVERTDTKDSGLNLSVGAMIQLHRHFVFQGGLDSFPSGVTMTGYLAVPW